MPIERSRPGRWQPLSAAAIALAVDGLYLAIIRNEGEGELTSGRVLFVAGCVAGAALALTWGLVLAPRARALLFTGAAAILVVWTLLAAFSIGILLAPAAAFAVLAAAGVGSSSRPEAALVALGAVVLVAAGLALT